MEKFTVITGIAISMLALGTIACSEKPTGEQLFQQHCSECHAGGENKINPEKTLKSDHLKGHGVTTPGAIVSIMRNPGPGMKKFDENIVPDKDARKIAEYILKTF